MIYSFNNSGFRDPETGVYNQAYFMEVFHREWFRHLRDKQTLVLLYIHPQLYEHSANPRVRETYTQSIQQGLLRNTDMLARLNSNTFAVGLFNTDDTGTKVVVERIKEQLSNFSNNYMQQHGIGVDSKIAACICQPKKSIKPETLFMTVDNLLLHPENVQAAEQHQDCWIATIH
ncbi:diguanylate cyclase domain-containing protein [Shewanella sp.]|uniref:diguanylate cyclase domain-containing protein n=1 Tax=Shewanella sp. TaxID=50422 RepID=UPI003A9842DC